MFWLFCPLLLLPSSGAFAFFTESYALFSAAITEYTLALLLFSSTSVSESSSSLSRSLGSTSFALAAAVASPFAYLLVPIVGVAAWQLAAAAITGFIAKENVVGTIATVYGMTSLISTEDNELIGSGSDVAAIIGITKVAALAYLMFNLYTPPCFAALGALNSELQSGKWLLGAICLQLATGFSVGFIVFQVGTLVTTGSLGAGFVGGLIAVLVFAAVIAGLIIRANKQIDTEYALEKTV